MRCLVFGAGALGSLLAARLSESHDTTLVGRRDHAEAIRERGLRVTGRTELVARRLVALAREDALPVEAPDVVLLTVKSYDTEGALARLEPFWDDSLFVSVQNGLGNEETIARRARRVLGAVINQGVTFLEPGVVFHAGEGDTEIGPFQESSIEEAGSLADAFRRAGLPARAVADVRARLWAKAVLNAAVNPLTALMRLKTGALLDGGELEAVMADVVAESVAVARAAGAPLEEEAVLATIRAVASATRDNKSSMLQDLERGRRTEIDAINGAIAERARALGLAAPLNELLRRLVKASERGR